MTTDDASATRPIGTLLRQGAAALGIWLVALAVITAALQPVPTLAIFGPSQRTLAALHGTDARIMRSGTGFIVVHGEEKGLVRRLYSQGALLVLPSRPAGCIRSGVTR